MKRIASVELKPGIEPTPNHIVQVVQQIKEEKPQILLYGAQNPRIPQQLAAETGIKILRLYSNAGGRPETDTYIKWIDYTVRTLVQAVSADHARAQPLIFQNVTAATPKVNPY